MSVKAFPGLHNNDLNENFDPGPPATWEALFAQAPLEAYAQHAYRHFFCGFGPVFYRGRLDGSARMLLVGQDPSVDEHFARRVLIGRSGQRVQGLLHKFGIARDYVMLNTFLCNVKHAFNPSLSKVALQPAILSFRNALFDRIMNVSRLEVILTLGDAAYLAVQHWPQIREARIPVIAIAHPSMPHQIDADVLRDWNRALVQLRLLVRPEQPYDATFYGDHFTDADLCPIPRRDLPFGLPNWIGTGGTRGRRTKASSPERLTWFAPED